MPNDELDDFSGGFQLDRKLKTDPKRAPQSVAPETKKADVAPGTGHRARLRARFLNGGIDALADYELLEMLLFGAIPRRDTKPLAKALIKTFDGYANVLAAPAAALLAHEGVTETIAATIKTVHVSAQKLAQEQVREKPILSSWRSVLDYVRIAMAHLEIEQFRILFLNQKNQLIADEVQQQGTINHTPVYPREVIKRALELGASAIILVHNHPSGDPTPSKADIDLTRSIAETAKRLDIAVHDHLIIARSGHESLKSLGFI